MRQMKWRKMMYNCNCGNRMDTLGVVSYKCNWCQNTFWTMRNGFKAIFCSINDWQNQITKVFEIGNIQSRNWKQYRCPKGFYVKQAAGRLGIEQEKVLGLIGMQIICSNLDSSQTVKVQDPSKHLLEEPSDNGPGTFVSAVSLKSQKMGRITGIKWIFEGIAQIKFAQITKYGEISEKSLQKTIEMIRLPKTESLKKVKVPLRNPWQISGIWYPKNNNYYGFRFGDIELNPPQYQMQKDQGLYKPIYSKVGFNLTSSTKYIPTSPVYATINPFSSITAFTVFQQIKTNVNCTLKIRFFDKTTQEFIMEKQIQVIYSGIVEGPISIFFEQIKCIGGWSKNNYIVNGDFQQNNCIRPEQWCIYDQTSISNNLPGWIPNPFFEIGRGYMYSNVYGDTWIAQLYIAGKANCMKQKLNLGPGLYSLSFHRTARRQNSLSASSLQVKFDGSSLKKIYPEDYLKHQETFQITLTQPTKDYWLEICAIGSGPGYSVILDDFKMQIYNDCQSIVTLKY